MKRYILKRNGKILYSHIDKDYAEEMVEFFEKNSCVPGKIEMITEEIEVPKPRWKKILESVIDSYLNSFRMIGDAYRLLFGIKTKEEKERHADAIKSTQIFMDIYYQYKNMGYSDEQANQKAYDASGCTFADHTPQRTKKASPPPPHPPKDRLIREGQKPLPPMTPELKQAKIKYDIFYRQYKSIGYSDNDSHWLAEMDSGYILEEEQNFK